MTIKRPTGHTLDSIKRQYKGGSNYKIEDKKNVLDWSKKMQVKGKKKQDVNPVNV